jgi:hypothetical protein
VSVKIYATAEVECDACEAVCTCRVELYSLHCQGRDDLEGLLQASDPELPAGWRRRHGTTYCPEHSPKACP